VHSSAIAEATGADDPEVVALVDRIVRLREPDAFADLYDRFLNQVYRYLFYRTGSREDAEDLTEQTFLKVWSALPRFRWQGKPFQAWLYGIARNTLVDHQRHARPSRSLDDPLRPLQLISQAAADALEQSLEVDVIARAVSQLPPDQREVIVLRFAENYDVAQVAGLLGQRERTVRRLQFQGLQALRQILERQARGLD
jgi:RNA polymerase sigma-70 factor (ECF subfamily)